MLRDALNLQQVMEWLKFLVFSWNLHGMFISPSPPGVRLVESCTICRVKVGLHNWETSSDPILEINFLRQIKTEALVIFLPFCPASYRAIAPTVMMFDLRGLPLYYENQKLFDLTTSRPRETMKQRPKFLFLSPSPSAPALIITR